MKCFFKTFLIMLSAIAVAPIIVTVSMWPLIPCDGMKFSEIVHYGMWWRFIVFAVLISAQGSLLIMGYMKAIIKFT